MVLQPFGQQFQAQRELAPPCAMLVELLVEGSAHCVPEVALNIASERLYWPSGFLAFGQKYVARWPWRMHFTGVAANPARLARPVVHHRLELEVAGLARAALEKSRSVLPPLATARASTSRTAACSFSARGRLMREAAQRRADAGKEQRFRCIDVAHAHDQVAGQQHLLDRRAGAASGRREKAAGSKASLRGSTPRPPEQLDCLRRVLGRRIHHRAEAARVVQAQHAAAGHQVEVVVRRRLAAASRQNSGCRTCPGAAAAGLRPGRAAGTCRAGARRAPCGPPARSACRPSGQRRGLPIRTDSIRRAGDAVGKTQAGDFDFGQFGHGRQSATAGAWIIMVR